LQYSILRNNESSAFKNMSVTVTDIKRVDLNVFVLQIMAVMPSPPS